jgi:formate hydrogenlyase transcriptional activator
MKASESLQNDQSTASESALRRAVDTTPALIHTARPDGYIDYFNRGWLDFFGKPLEDVCGWRWTETVHPEDVAAIVQKWHAALASGEPFEIEARVRRADGLYRALLHRKLPLRDEHGNIVKWFGSSMDIEDRKFAEQRIAEKTSQLERSEFYLREGERLAHMGSWSLRPDGVFDYWSPETFAIFGFDPAKGFPTLKQWIDVLNPSDGDRVNALIRKMFSEGVKGDIQYRVAHPERRQKTMHSTGEPMFEDGEVARLIGNTLDITAQEELTQELRRREAYLAEAQRLSHTGSFGWDVSSGEIFWSDETFRIFELDPKTEITTELIVQRTHPDDRRAVQQVIKRASSERTEFALEHRLSMPDGSIKFVHVVGRPSTDEGRRSEFVGAVTDITDQRRAEKSLRQSESYLTEAQRLSHTGSWAWSPEVGIKYWSEEFYRLHGFDPRDGLPRFEELFQRMHPDDQPTLKELMEKMVREKMEFEYDYRLVHPDGAVRDIHTTGHPVVSPTGDLVEYMGTAIDITERKRAEDDLRRAFEDIKALRDELQRENIVLREELGKTSMFEEVIGTSPVLQMVLARAAKVAPTDSTVLIMGETGTGKELIARAIHKRSKRAERPFISVNCAAVPTSLIMSELFGHEKGAFTGAVQRRLGRFELAEGGTIFLDEVGDLPAETQIALLRVLQEREFERVGGTEVLPADVRVISATNRDLQGAIADGGFRSDLYYRLNVFPIKLPPLRERKEDVPLLVNYFVDRYAKRAGKKIKHIQKKALEVLREYSWPGNVRELQNVIERSLIIGETTEFSIDKSWVANEPQPSGAAPADQKTNERNRIETALAQSNGRVSGAHGAAAKLGIPASTLESKIRSLRINKFQFKGV